MMPGTCPPHHRHVLWIPRFYVQPITWSAIFAGPWTTVAIDCEMCYTSEGLELTRASVVGPDGSVIYDKLVMPPRPITNYNTAHSGITAVGPGRHCIAGHVIHCMFNPRVLSCLRFLSIL